MKSFIINLHVLVLLAFNLSGQDNYELDEGSFTVNYESICPTDSEYDCTYRYTFTAQPNEGFIFSHWEIDGQVINQNPYIIDFNYSVNGAWDDGEVFTDALNGIYDEGEAFTDALNGVYDIGEEFVDVPNGVYDEGEAFTDAFNGVYDIGEEFVDVANGVYDEGEGFVDSLNGVYDEGESFVDQGSGVYEVGEPFDDDNDNGVYDLGEIFTDTLNGIYDEGEEFADALNGVYDIGEEFFDVPNGVYDEGEEFTDALNGVYDIGEEFVDAPNGVYDEGEEFTDALNGVYDIGESFVDAPNGIYDEGEEFVDENANGIYDPGTATYYKEFEDIYDMGGWYEYYTDYRDVAIGSPEEATLINTGWQFYDIQRNSEYWIDLPNGVYDPDEAFVDDNSNGVYDEGEVFTDAQNGLWDAGEAFVDENANGVYDPGIAVYRKEIEEYYEDTYYDYWTDYRYNVIIGSPEEATLIRTGWQLDHIDTSPEQFTDALLNGVYDEGEEFTDALNGLYDEGEDFVDANSNGIYDGGEEFIDSILNFIDASHIDNIEQFSTEAFYNEIYGTSPTAASSDYNYYVDNTTRRVALNSDATFMLLSNPYKYVGGIGWTVGQIELLELVDGNWQQVFYLTGNFSNERLGDNIGISSDGKTIAFKSAKDDQGSNSQRVLVYTNNNGNWEQKGASIFVSSDNNYYANSFVMNDLGNRIVVSNPFSSNGDYSQGSFKIYDFIDGEWVNQGIFHNSLHNSNNGSIFSFLIDISGDGETIISSLNDSNDNNIFIYKLENESWFLSEQLNIEIIGGNNGDESILLNRDGSTFVAANGRDDSVVVYKSTGSGYQQIGSKLISQSGNQFGLSVDINDDGNIILVGSPGYSELEYQAGMTQTFKFINRDWNEVGSPVYGSEYENLVGHAVSLDSSGSTFISISKGKSDQNLYEYKFLDLSDYSITSQSGSYLLNVSNNLIAGNIVLPYAINSSSYELSPSAFKNCSLIESISIPDHINQIPDSVFENCTSLQSIELSSSLTSLGNNVFKNCSNLILSDSFLDISSVGDSAFENSGITFFNIGPGCSVGDNAFKNASFLKIVTIGEGSTFGSNVFSSCSSLDYVYLDETPDSFSSDFFTSANPNVTIISNSDRNFDLSFLSNQVEYINIDSYTINSNILSSASDLLLDVYIPAFFEGEFITSMQGYMISSNNNVTSVVVPPNYKTIPGNFITGCNALSTVFLPDSITSIGISSFKGNSILSAISLPKNLNSMGTYSFAGTFLNEVVIPEKIKEIPNYTFKDCSHLTTVVLPNTIESLGEYCFYNSSLSSINIPGSIKHIGNYAFSDCSNLQSVILNEGVESIGYRAFEDCRNLSSLQLPDTLKDIGSRAFYNSYNLSSLQLPDSLTTIQSWAFANSGLASISIPGSIKIIEENVFSNCTNLQSVILNEGVESIGYRAFYNCHNLSSLQLPDSLTTIGNYAFHYAGLTSVSIPGSVVNISEGAFYMAQNLKTVNLNEGTRIINTSAFYNTNIEEISLPSTVQLISDEAFNYSALERVIFKGNYPTVVGDPFSSYSESLTFYITSNSTGFDNITEYTVKFIEVDQGVLEFITDDSQATLVSCDSSAEGGLIVPATFNDLPVRFISNNALEGCALINSIELPESIVEIGSFAFAGCTSLSSINIPSGLTEIKDSTFAGCISLTSIQFPVGLNVIGSNAFKNSGLTELSFPNTLNIIGQSAFANCDGITSFVVNASLDLGTASFSNMDSLQNVYFNGDNIYGDSSSIFLGSNLLAEIFVLKQATGWSDKFEGIDVIVQTPIYFVGDIPETGIQLFVDEQCIIKAYNDQQDPALYEYQWYYNSILIPEFLQGRADQLLIEGNDYNQSNWSVEVTDISSGTTNIFNFYLDIIRDSDGDGLFDYVETGTGKYISLEDTGTDPNSSDSDGDTIDDKTEILLGLNPNSIDSDGDGLNDNNETGTGVYVSVNDTGTDPLLNDSDGDGYSDSFEISLINFNPTNFNNFQFSDHGMYAINDPVLLSYIKDLRAGSTTIEIHDGQATLTMEVEESDDLGVWTNASATSIQIPIDTEAGKKFFRFKMTE